MQDTVLQQCTESPADLVFGEVHYINHGVVSAAVAVAVAVPAAEVVVGVAQAARGVVVVVVVVACCGRSRSPRGSG